jgi:hypothetical protein
LNFATMTKECQCNNALMRYNNRAVFLLCQI